MLRISQEKKDFKALEINVKHKILVNRNKVPPINKWFDKITK